MTSNNLEAIELVKEHRLNYRLASPEWIALEEVIELLQADEVKDNPVCYLCKQTLETGERRIEDEQYGIRHQFGCPTPPKPTKETKLGAFKEELMARKSYFDITDLVELIDILEEEY